MANDDHGPGQKVIYTNWRGETAERTITPITTWFGSTEWHPEPQYFVQAWDHEKGAVRDFALRDFGHQAPPNPPEKPDSSGLLEAVERKLWDVNCPDQTYDEALSEAKAGNQSDAKALKFIHDLADDAIAVVVERCAAQCDDLARGARKLEAETERKAMGRERALAAESLAAEIRALERRE